MRPVCLLALYRYLVLLSHFQRKNRESLALKYQGTSTSRLMEVRRRRQSDVIGIRLMVSSGECRNNAGQMCCETDAGGMVSFNQLRK